MTENFEAKISEGFDNLPDNFDSVESAPVEATPAPAPEPTSEPAQESAAPEPTSAPSQTQPVQFSKDYQDWLNKYNGDRDKADRAIWETNNRNAQLAKEREELARKVQEYEARLAAPPAPAQPETPPPPPPELARQDEKLRVITQRYNQTEQEKRTHANTWGQANDVINRLNYQLASGQLNFDEQEGVRRDLAQALRQRSNAEALYNQAESRREGLLGEYETAKSIREQTDLLIRQRQELERLTSQFQTREQSTQDEVITRDAQSFVQQYRSAAATIAGEGEKLDGDLAKRFVSYAERYFRADDDSVIASLAPEQIPDYLRKVKAEFLADAEQFHRHKSTVYGAQKTKDTTVNAPDGKKAVAPADKRRGFTSDDEFSAHLNAAWETV